MAAITFHSCYRAAQLRARFGNLFSACRDMIDRFASDRMRHAAAAADNFRKRQSRSTPSGAAVDQAPASAARFAPLGADVLSATIPAFFIGRNELGLWVAREAQGRTGGIFLLKASALAFARARSGTAGCATIFPSETIELDLVNEGNPLAVRLARLIRSATGL